MSLQFPRKIVSLSSSFTSKRTFKSPNKDGITSWVYFLLLKNASTWRRWYSGLWLVLHSLWLDEKETNTENLSMSSKATAHSSRYCLRQWGTRTVGHCSLRAFSSLYGFLQLIAFTLQSSWNWITIIFYFIHATSTNTAFSRRKYVSFFLKKGRHAFNNSARKKLPCLFIRNFGSFCAKSQQICTQFQICWKRLRLVAMITPKRNEIATSLQARQKLC